MIDVRKKTVFKMFKGDDVKLVKNKDIEDILVKAGWAKDGEKSTDPEREELFVKAVDLGLEPHVNLGVKKLKALIADAI